MNTIKKEIIVNNRHFRKGFLIRLVFVAKIPFKDARMLSV